MSLIKNLGAFSTLLDIRLVTITNKTISRYTPLLSLQACIIVLCVLVCLSCDFIFFCVNVFRD